QAIPPTIPMLGNYLIILFKEVPLAATIGVLGILQLGRDYGAVTWDYVEPLTIVAGLFLILSYPSAILISKQETRINRRFDENEALQERMSSHGVRRREDKRRGTHMTNNLYEKEYEGMTKPIVKYEDVDKSFCDVEVFKGIDLEIKPAEKVAVIGPSGSGKTTIIRMLMTLEQQTKGKIIVDGNYLWHMDNGEYLVTAN